MGREGRKKGEEGRRGGGEEGRRGGGEEGKRVRGKISTAPASEAEHALKPHQLMPLCNVRREKVGALYSTVSGLLAVIRRAYTLTFSLLCHRMYVTIG